MATSSTTVVYKIPASYAANQTFPAAQGAIYTDTEADPTTSTTYRSLETNRAIQNRQTLLKVRTISVQTATFRTDQDNGAVNFSKVYTSVTEDKL